MKGIFLKLTFHFCLLLFLAACSISSITPTNTPAVTITPLSETSIPPTPTQSSFEIPAPRVGTVAYDFIAHLCEAKWSNNGQILLCPSDLTNIQPGYVALMDRTIMEGMIYTEALAIITLPAQGGGFYGIFGKFPPFTVQAGDRFRTALACQGDAQCNVEYSLEYYDANGVYHDNLASWNHQYGGGPTMVDFDLNQLANQTVEFTLVVRDNADPAGDWALWVAPYIYRP